VSSPARRSTGLLSAARPEEGAVALAARHGAGSNRPAIREDAVVRRVVLLSEVKWVVKNPETTKYYNFEDDEWGLVALFDGTRTLAEIQAEYQQRFPEEKVEMALILEYYEMLREMDLLAQTAAEKNLTLLARARGARQRAADEKAEGFNPFFLLFHVLDPNRFLDRTVRYVRWIWTPPVVAAALAFNVWCFGVILIHWDTVWNGTMELYALTSKPLIDVFQFFFILTFIGAIHEFAHAYAVKIYGGDVHDIGIALLYFTPAFYCDTTDSVLFESKWHRLWVTTAGIYVEAFMCSVATVVWLVSYPDTLLHEIAFKTVLFTGVSTVFFNVNPLIKIDGYYALSSLVEIPDLREESFRYIGAVFQRKVLHLPVEVPPASRRKRRIYWIFGLCALAWVTVIMRFIGGLFLNLYNHFFPNWAVILVVLTMYRLFRKRVRLVTRTAQLFYLDKKELLMSPRVRTGLLAAAAVLALLFFLPWSRRTLRAPAELKPMATVRLEAPEDAVVAEVLVQEGDRVAAGQPVFRLESPALAEETARLTSERGRIEGRTSRARQNSDAGGVFRSERQSGSVTAALKSGEARQQQLVVRSPIAGRVLTPHLRDLGGRSVPAGTLLAEVGKVDQLRAELPVTERLLDDLAPKDTVTALFKGRMAPAHGTVASISSATLENPATTRSGAEPSAPREHPEQFVAVAIFENADGSLLPGMVGGAKIHGRRASYAARSWRVVKRWVQSVAW
jgi:putative peptide zinc metalloprotease protein